MILIRRSAGLGGVALSAISLLLCIAIAAGASAGKRKVDAVNVAVFGTADEAFAFIEARLDRAGERLDAGRPRVNRVSALAEQLKTRTGDARTELEPLVRTLDETFEHLKSAEAGLESARAIALRVNRVTEAIASSRASHESGDAGGARGAGAVEIAELSASVADAVAHVHSMRQDLIDFRESGQLAREVAARIIARAAGFDERLASASAKVSRYKTKISTARAKSVELGRRIHWWTAFAAALVMLGSLWFAMSQLLVMRSAWRLTHS